MSSIEPITFKIIESITPTINENIKILLDENNNYKQKYENLLNEHKMLLDFPFVKNIITNMKSEINTLKNKSEKITLEINEKKNSVTDIDTDTHTHTRNETIATCSSSPTVKSSRPIKSY